MRVKLGWSGETGSSRWEKVDVQLEDVDLDRIFHEHSLPPELAQRLPTKVCFTLLQNEAELLLLGKLRDLGYPSDKVDDRSTALYASTAQIVSAIQDQLTASYGR